MKPLLEYALFFSIIMFAAIIYFKIAAYYNIVDKPNERSSHKIPTIRGGGVIFLLSALLFYFMSNYSFPYLLAAMLVSGVVSFIDDMRTVNNPLKFGVHILSVGLIFIQCGLVNTLPPLYLIVIGMFFIGVINAYNFMDGINGITGLYTLAVIVPLFLTEDNEKIRSLELFTIIGLLVFNYFNTRKKARCFAGDVGSISLAILIVFLLIMRIQLTGRFVYIGLLLVYGIDTIFTIAQRLYQQENIFKPHRKHLYQYYCNEKKMPHVLVSSLYAFLQLIISLAIVYGYLNILWLLILLIVLCVFYWILKAPLIKTASP